MVLLERLELSHLAAPDPKSGVSTNSTTKAFYFVAEAGIEPARPLGARDFKSLVSTYSTTRPSESEFIIYVLIFRKFIIL